MAELEALFGYIKAKREIKELSWYNIFKRKKLEKYITNQIEMFYNYNIFDLVDAFLSYNERLKIGNKSYSGYSDNYIDFNGKVVKIENIDYNLFYHPKSRKFVVDSKPNNMNFYIYKKKDNLPKKYHEIWNKIKSDIVGNIIKILDIYVEYFIDVV